MSKSLEILLKNDAEACLHLYLLCLGYLVYWAINLILTQRPNQGMIMRHDIMDLTRYPWKKKNLPKSKTKKCLDLPEGQ